MFLKLRKNKRQLWIHILLALTYTKVILKDTPLPILLAAFVKITIKNLTNFILFGNQSTIR